MGKLDEPEHGIAAELPRNANGVAIDTVHMAVAIAQVATDPGDNAKRQSCVLKDRPLLDMDLNVTLNLIRTEKGFARIKRI
jgi:hypothetical protein